MEDDRPPAEQPATDGLPPPSAAPPASTPAPTPVVSWGPPPGTTAPVQWGVAEAMRVPPPPGTVYAGVGIRFVAWILDLIPLIVLVAFLIGPVIADLLTAMVESLPARPRPGQTSFPELQAAMSEAMGKAFPGLTRASALLQVALMLYFAGSWLVFSRSPGMALLGLRIVREEDGGRLDLARVAVRFAGYLLGASLLLAGFIWAIFDTRKQAWHDKLAGTVVVRSAPYAAPQASLPAPAPAPVDGEMAPPDAPAHRRPSIGGVAEAAWRTFRRSPLDLLASLAVVLIPAAIVMLPLIALYLVAQQDQVVISFQLFDVAFRVEPSDYAQFLEYNRRIVASAAPTLLISAVTALLGSITASLLIGACAAAVDEARSVRPAGTATRLFVERLPALLALGIGAGLLFGLGFLLAAIPAFSAISADPSTFDPARLALAAVLGVFVIAPLSLYLGAVWLLAVVCVVREGLGPAAAFRRGWGLSRGRMRWLVGLIVTSALVAASVLVPLGMIPVGLLAEDYLGGGRLATAVSVVTLGSLLLLAAPVFALAIVEAYRAARDDAPRATTA